MYRRCAMLAGAVVERRCINASSLRAARSELAQGIWCGGLETRPVDMRVRVTGTLGAALVSSSHRSAISVVAAPLCRQLGTSSAVRTASAACGPTKQCPGCGQTKDFSQYSKSRLKWGKCKSCLSEYKKQRANTKEGYLSKLAANCRERDNGRKMVSTVTTESLLQLAENQDDRCALLNVPLVYKPYSPFQASLDRIDDAKGYVQSSDSNSTINTVRLVASEINTRQKWTTWRLDRAFGTTGAERAKMAPTSDEVERIAVEMETCQLGGSRHGVPSVKRRAVKDATTGDTTHLSCGACQEMLPVADFGSNSSRAYKKQSVCKPCASVKRSHSYKTWRGCVIRLVANAKSHHNKRLKQRAKKGQPADDYVCTLTHAKIADQFRKQKGLCRWSGLPLESQGRHWKISVERLDTTLSYSDDNWVLICVSLNAADRSVQLGEDDQHKAKHLGWNDDKIAKARQCYTERRAVAISDQNLQRLAATIQAAHNAFV
jgi:hypothetical protein